MTAIRPSVRCAIACAVAAWLATAPGANADGPGDTPEGASPAVQQLLSRWARGLRGLSSLRVTFRQTKTLRVLRRPRVSDGVALVKGRKVKLVTRRGGAVETELLVGDDVRLHYPRLKRLEVYPREGRGGSLPFPLFGGDVEALPADFHLQVIEADETQTLVMRPRLAEGETAPYREARMTFATVGEGLRVASLVQLGTRGRVEIEVRRWEPGAAIADAALQLAIPAGTEVVRLTAR